MKRKNQGYFKVPILIRWRRRWLLEDVNDGACDGIEPRAQLRRPARKLLEHQLQVQPRHAEGPLLEILFKLLKTSVLKDS